MKKLILPIALVFVMMLGYTVPVASALVSKSAEYYVADYAGVLTTKTKENIIDSNGGLEYECRDAQIVVVTIEYLSDGLDSREYAYRLFNDWGVGSRTENNGMLLLFVTEEKLAWLAVGNGISNAFTDTMADDYFNRHVWTDFDAGRYDAAANKMLDALFTWYGDYYGVNNGVNQDGGYYGQSAQEGSFWGDLIAFLVIFFIVVVIIVFAAVGSDRSRHRAYYVHHGIPRPRYHFWYMWRPGPYRPWYRTHHHNNWRGGPRGPRGPRGPGGGGFGGSGHSGRGSGFGGRTGGSGGGRSGGGGFGGFSGGGRSGGGFGGFGGGGRSGRGGGFGGGAGGGGGRK